MFTCSRPRKRNWRKSCQCLASRRVALAEDDRVDGRPAPSVVHILDPLPDKGEIQISVEVPVEVVSGDQTFKRDCDGPIECADLRWTKHGRYTRREARGAPETRARDVACPRKRSISYLTVY